MKPVRDYLLDLMEYIGYLQAFTAEGRDALDSDVKTRLAVINSYMIIGEIVKRLPEDLLSQQPQIRWKNIKGFRDILTHKYDDIDSIRFGKQSKICPTCEQQSKHSWPQRQRMMIHSSPA